MYAVMYAWDIKLKARKIMTEYYHQQVEKRLVATLFIFFN